MKNFALGMIAVMLLAGCAGAPPLEHPEQPTGQGAGVRLEIADRADIAVKGSPYVIKVQSTGSTHPSQVRIFVQLEEGGEWLQFPAVRVSEIEFRMTMHSVQASFTYYAKTGDTETPRYKLNVR